MRRLLILSGLFLSGCASRQQTHPPYGFEQQPFAPSSPARSSFSGVRNPYDEDAYPGGKHLAVPRRGRATDAVDLVVRPDVITAEFAVREVRTTPDEALAAARAGAADVIDRLTKATGGALSIRLRGVEAEKVIRPHEGPPEFIGAVVTVDGLLEVELPGAFDFWARSQLFINLLELTARISNDARSKDEPLRAVKFEDITPAVKNPEAYRGPLTERWLAQARAFATLAQSKDAPLALVDCAPPRAISQTHASLEEVTLQLALNCRIDVANPSPTRTPVKTP